jgi:hypothetical protein
MLQHLLFVIYIHKNYGTKTHFVLLSNLPGGKYWVKGYKVK